MGEGWSKTRFSLYAALVVITYVVSQAAAVVWLGLDAADTGAAITAATLASMAACIALMRLLVRTRAPGPWAYLGLGRVPWKSVLQGCLVMALFMAASDLLTNALGRPVVPPFMREAFASAGSVPLFMIAIVVAAPLLEEVFFRGFLTSGLAAYMPSAANAVLTSALWAIIHTQYGAYEIATIFVMGLLLAAARFHFRSLWPGVAMHSLANGGAFLQAAFL